MMKHLPLISSIILNSFLLIYLFGLIPFLLFISILINLGIIFYIRFLLNDRAKLYSDFNSLLHNIDKFADHMSQIYELEMFYGDETLESLINHSKNLIDSFYQYQDEYFNEVAEDEIDMHPGETHDREIQDNTENTDDPPGPP